MKIGLIVAMEKEFKQLHTLLHDAQTLQYSGKTFVTGTIGTNEIVLQQCGIGKVNAAIGTVEMLNHFHPQLIISSGCAGGADLSLEVTDVVVSASCTYHDAYCGSECAFGQIFGMPATYESPADLVNTALALHTDTRIHAGLIVSGDWFVDSREKMAGILQQFPQAKAVDMESCSIAQTCHLYGVPFISFRIISDVPLNDHKAQMYYDFWERMAAGSFEVTRNFLTQIQ